MDDHAVIPNDWEVSASGNLLGMLLLFDVKGRDADEMIVS
jgi:hypothetical protein